MPFSTEHNAMEMDETIETAQPSPGARPHISDPKPFSPARMEGWLRVIDLLALLVGYFCARLFLIITQSGPESAHELTLLVGIVVIMLGLRGFELYRFSVIKNKSKEWKNIFSAITIGFMAILVISFTYANEIWFTRTWFGSWYVFSLISVYAARALTWKISHSLAERGKLKRRVAIYGSGPQCERFSECLRADTGPWVTIIGVFDDREIPREEASQSVSVIGNIRDLVDLCRLGKVDDVIIALPWSADIRIMDVLRRLENLPVNIKTAPDMINFAIPNIGFESFSGMAVLDVSAHRLSGSWAVLKSLEDYTLTLVLLLFLAPCFIVIAILVKLSSPGPIFFRQPRLGLNNRAFEILKFRTMYHNRPPEVGTPQATKHDPRVTPIGRILRRTSLDELPQLFNVLGGSMSLIGPRPHAIAHNEFYGDVVDRYFVRHRVKPGITGWAQIHGFRGETEDTEKMRLRIEYDIAYIEKWSPFLDMLILIKTILVVFFQKTAY
jgi:Undecaprenyl-phosphate glucose phosphotransferase